MQEGQDWCLQCGAAAQRRAGTAPGWRSAAIAIAATTLLALGAAAAAYAALRQHPAHRRPSTIAQTPPVTSSTVPPTTSAPGATPGATPRGETQLPPLPKGPRTLNAPSGVPQIPSSTPNPRGGNGTGLDAREEAELKEAERKGEEGGGGNGGANRQAGKNGRRHRGGGEQGQGAREGEQGAGSQQRSEAEGEGEGETGEGRGNGGKPHKPVPILLDTNAASVYNPRDLPASRFGDPSLAIDGEATTAWSVELEPSEAPSVGVGLALDLNAALRVKKLSLVTETPGMTVKVYGTASAALPSSLDAPAWKRLTRAHLVKKRRATIDLKGAPKRFRQLLIWIVKAPTAAGGGFTGSELKVNEVQLFEAK